MTGSSRRWIADVLGNTASLSDAPVTCSASGGGITVKFTWTR